MTITIAEVYGCFGWPGLADALNCQPDWIGPALAAPLLTTDEQSSASVVNNPTLLVLTPNDYEQIRLRHGPSFPDTRCEDAYQAYLKTADTVDETIGYSDQSTDAAIHFLGCICDYYLSKLDGDFLKITRSDTWER